VKKKDKESKLKNKEYVNNRKFVKRRSYVQGQSVLIKDQCRSRKFDPYYEREPYIIVNKEGDLLHVQRRSDDRMLSRHVSHVKPYYSRQRNVQSPHYELTDTYEDLQDDAADELDDGQPLMVLPENEEDNANEVDVEQPVEQHDEQVELRRSGRSRTATRNTVYRDFEVN
jgi:hypothetical protein